MTVASLGDSKITAYVWKLRRLFLFIVVILNVAQKGDDKRSQQQKLL